MAGSAGEVNTYGECNWWRTVQKEGEMASYPQQFHCRELKTVNVHPLKFPALNFTYISSNLIKMLRTVAHHYVINPWPRFVFPNSVPEQQDYDVSKPYVSWHLLSWHVLTAVLWDWPKENEIIRIFVCYLACCIRVSCPQNSRLLNVTRIVW